MDMNRLSRAVLLAAIVTAAGPAEAAPAVGDMAPSLVASETGGGTFDLAALRGKVVIVNFWATRCAPCREEMPALDAFYEKHHAQGLEMVGISVDRSRDRDAVAKALLAVHYPAAILADADTNGFGKPVALPVTYVVDAGGTVRSIMTPDADAITADSLEHTVGPLL